MTVPKYAAMAAILAVPMLLVGKPAEAFTARQAASQGQGIFVTSSGTPENLIPSGPVIQPGDDSNRRPLRSGHHDRYFAGY